MSDFSDLLDHAIARSNLSMLELQEASGIPISYLYKLRKGVRFTKKYTPNVLSLIYALQCPKAEEARLLQEFQIETIGKETFRCLHSIRDIIASIGPRDLREFPPVSSEIHDFSSSARLSGELEINACLRKLLLEQAAQKEKGSVLMLGGEQHSFLKEIIPPILHNSDVQVRHLFRLDSHTYPESESHNLETLKPILRYFFCGFGYHPKYIYTYNDSYDRRITIFDTLLIFGHKIAIAMTGEDHGLVLTSPDEIVFFEARFQDLYNSGQTLMTSISGLMGLQNAFMDAEATVKNYTYYSLENSFCSLSFLSKDMLFAHLAVRDEETEQLLADFLRRSEYLLEQKRVFYYTKDSVRQFLADGKLEYLPQDLYTPLNPQERLLVLRRLLNRCTHPTRNLEYHLILDNAFPIHPNAMIDALSKSANFVGYYNNDDVFETYRIKEPNLSKWIYFFLESLASSNWVYSNEEQAAFLEDEIQKFSQEH